MATIKVGENETLDSALRRFKRRCARDGIIGDLRKKEQYEIYFSVILLCIFQSFFLPQEKTSPMVILLFFPWEKL